MTISMLHRYKAPDSSADINSRLKGVSEKGFVDGAEITPVPSVLEIEVDPFILVTFDGGVVISDEIEQLEVVDSEVNYIVAYAKYRVGDSPVLQVKAMTDAAYLADPDIDWLHVIGVVDLSSGGPHSDVPTSSISYVERHSLDPQRRSPWRDPVATAGALPSGDGHHNRDGDVRLVKDTGSFYWWNEAGSSWEVFDEVPLNAHRDNEHSNGLAGDSSFFSLRPIVSGTNISVAQVFPGSGASVNGNYLTIPSSTTTIAASSVGAVRGLIQVYLTDTGTVDASFRITKDADALDISQARIIDCSDNLSTGTFTLLFNDSGQTLSWAGGEPVVVDVSGTFRLFNPTGEEWIDVRMANVALPGVTVSDNYIVSASAKTDAQMLIAHYFWDGSSVLTVRDRRVFGTTGKNHIGTDFKDEVIVPSWSDLRGNMVYSGGDCSEVSPPSLNLRVTGPVITYLAGKRYVAPGNYSGIALPINTTSYIYIDLDQFGNPRLTRSSTDPATVVGLLYAAIAVAVTDGTQITSITDMRDPQIVVGNATRDAYVRFTPVDHLRYSVADGVMYLESGGTSIFNADTLQATTVEAKDTDLVLTSSTGDVTISTTGSGDDVIISAVDGVTITANGADIAMTVTSGDDITMGVTGAGEIRLASNNGKIQLQTDGGDISIGSNGSGDVLLGSASGTVTITGTDLITLTSAKAAGTAILIESTDASGTIEINARGASGGLNLAGTGGVSIASNGTVEASSGNAVLEVEPTGVTITHIANLAEQALTLVVPNGVGTLNRFISFVGETASGDDTKPIATDWTNGATQAYDTIKVVVAGNVRYIRCYQSAED